MGNSKYTNALANETSPYLLQHAHNPVNWFPWNTEALELARKLNKPILVSIGYSACHWCHVMERESFEDEAIAALMNEFFVNIKIDREERPDLDHIYMDAVQAMTGSGGWPLNVFLTPGGKPFYGGTYFPPSPAYNMPSWKEVITGVANAFRENRENVEEQAERLTDHLRKSNSFGQRPSTGEVFYSREMTDTIYQHLMKNADRAEGGFGRAPKFPQSFSIRYLLRYYHYTGEKEALEQVELSLTKMIRGGIYDQLGGGFARYSTDSEWLVPHFEKMLYDNALLLETIAEAYQITGKEEYRRVLIQTIEFLNTELRSPEGAYFAALDADSEGEEGRYYVWSEDEIDRALGKDAAEFKRFFGVSSKGNWEGKNILNVKQAIPPEIYQPAMENLLDIRNKRVKPGLDDKIILGWNALMVTALSRVFAATGIAGYKNSAMHLIDFLLDKFSNSDGSFFHTWKKGEARLPAFLDDYASLITALITVQEISGEQKYLLKARELTEYVIEHFSEPDTGFFFYTHRNQQDVIIRKKEVYDGAVPSGNSQMMYNLHYLSVVFDKKSWSERVEKVLSGFYQVVQEYPGSFGNWAGLILERTAGTRELVVVGKDYPRLLNELLRKYLPFRVLQSSSAPDGEFPLLTGKPSGDFPVIYNCFGYQCQPPVKTVEELF